MTRKAAKYVSLKHYGLPDISMPAIRRYARKVEQFKPDKIILFGSFAYGEPNEHSDVDLLVVMKCPNEFTQAVRIRLALRAPFALDLVIRTPENLRMRLEEEDWFLREVVDKGNVLYEKSHRKMGTKRRSRPSRRQTTRKRSALLS